MLNEEEKKAFKKLQKRIGRNMREVRIAQEKTQEEMSELIGLELRYYQRLEYGDYSMTARNLFRIANRMGVNVKKLVS